MQRLIAMLTRIDPNELTDKLRRHVGALSGIASAAGAELRLAVRLADDPLGAQAGDRSVIPLSGVVELTERSDDAATLESCAAPLAAALGSFVAPGDVSLLVGQVHELLPAKSDDLLLVLAATRLASMSQAEFHAYWLEQHAALAMSLMGDDDRRRMGYQQLHVDADRTTSVAARTKTSRARFDGVLEVGLAALDDLPHIRIPGFAQAIEADEANFADRSAPMCGAFLQSLDPEQEASS